MSQFFIISDIIGNFLVFSSCAVRVRAVLSGKKKESATSTAIKRYNTPKKRPQIEGICSLAPETGFQRTGKH